MKKILIFSLLFMFCLWGCDQETQKTETEGLEYQLSTDGTYYILSDIGTATDKDIIIPGEHEGLPVVKIKDNAFLNSSIESVKIPNTVQIIGKSAFADCINLEIIVIPNSVTHILENAFYGCNNLIIYCEAQTRPSTWRHIDRPIHMGVGSSNIHVQNGTHYILNSQTKEARLAKYNVESNKKIDVEESIKVSNIEYTITKIDDYAFYKCISITDVELPNTITSIGQHAFSGCSSLESIVIPNNVTCIEECTFLRCGKLKSITLPAGIKKFGSEAFVGCNELENVYYLGTIEEWLNIEFADSKDNPMHYADNFYMLDNNNEYYLLTELIISDTIKEITIKKFEGFKCVKKLIIPNSVESIEIGSFSEYTNLESITIPFVGVRKEDSRGETFGFIFGNPGQDRNYSPKSLEEVIITGGEEIGDSAFCFLDKIKSITIPNTVKFIGRDAFFKCLGLENIYFNGTLEEWKNIEFYNEDSNPMIYAKHLFVLNENNEYYEVIE